MGEPAGLSRKPSPGIPFGRGRRAPVACPVVRVVVFAGLILAALVPCAPRAQELEPRRWTHLPTGMNFLGMGYAYTETSISDSPALKLQNVEGRVHTVAARYIRTFELLGRTARAEVAQVYHDGNWSGLLDGTPASTSRSGWGDTIARLAVDLVGAPPLSGKEYAVYRSTREVETIVGAALAVHLPTGEYLKDRLINLGSNRITIRPQAGVVHNRGNWSMELTGEAWIFTDNDSFFKGNRLETDPLLTVQAHVTYTFRPGLWVGAGTGLGYGARSTLNGEKKDDRKNSLAFGVGFGYPLARDLGLVLRYAGTRRRATNGSDTDTLSLSISRFW
jgi:hypothetical protein